MTLCDDCLDIRLAKHIKGMQKIDKRVLMRQNKHLNEHSSYGSPEYRLDVTKAALAKLEWKAWSMNVQDVVREAVKDSIICRKFNNANDMPYPLLLANLGSRLQRQPLRNCTFCSLLSNIRIPPHNHVPGSNVDVLVAFRYFRRPNEDQRWDYDGTTSDVVMISVFSSDRWTTESTEYFDFPKKQHYKPRGFLMCRLRDCETDVSQSVPASPSTINFEKIARAIMNCRQNHRRCRIKKTVSPLPIAISLIDCYTREVIQTTSLRRYVTLSYVWGEVSVDTLDNTTLPPTLPCTLPRTHEDAIQVTKALGFRYIWIDQFCVNQGDHAMKHQQLRTMGRVYEDAMVTLVAASGPDANAGLPGVSDHPRNRSRPSVRIDGCIISEEAAPIDTEIRNSVWAGRGWTFQEQFFSRKFVVFTSEQMSFECRENKYSPRFGTYHWETRKSQTKPLPAWDNLYSRLHERIDIRPLQTRETYQYLVKEYWPRQLTRQEDGINAFAGALEHLKGLWNAELSQDRLTFTAGMPHLLEHREQSSDQGLRLFAQGLAWYSKNPSKRRRNFPSWCWAGWTPLKAQQSSLAWLREGEYTWPLIRDVSFKISWDVETFGATGHQDITTSELVPIARHESSNVPTSLVLDAPLINPSAVSWWLGDDEPTLWGCKASWFPADKIRPHANEFLDNLNTGTYCLIALRHVEGREHYREGVFLLVRQASQSQHERIGLVHMGVRSKVTFAQWHSDAEFRTWELI